MLRSEIYNTDIFQEHLTVYMSKEDVNRIGNSNLVVNKISFLQQMSAQNFVTLENLFLLFSEGQISR